MTTSQVKDENGITRREALVAKLRTMTGPLLHVPPAQIDVDARFLEMGADSLVLIEAVRTIEETFGITLTIQQLFEDVTSLADLAAYLDRMLPPDVIVGEPVPQQLSVTDPVQGHGSKPLIVPQRQSLDPVQPLDTGALKRLFAQQLQIMTQQLVLLQGDGTSASVESLLSSAPETGSSNGDGWVEIEL